MARRNPWLTGIVGCVTIAFPVGFIVALFGQIPLNDLIILGTCFCFFFALMTYVIFMTDKDVNYDMEYFRFGRGRKMHLIQLINIDSVFSLQSFCWVTFTDETRNSRTIVFRLEWSPFISDSPGKLRSVVARAKGEAYRKTRLYKEN